MSVPPFGRSRRFVRSAAGFIATRTFGWSPGVRMSWSAKWSWKLDTPGSDSRGRADLGWKSGNVERSLPISAVSLRRTVSCAYTVLGIAREADHHAVELLDRLAHRFRIQASTALKQRLGVTMLVAPVGKGVAVRASLSPLLRCGSEASAAARAGSPVGPTLPCHRRVAG